MSLQAIQNAKPEAVKPKNRLLEIKITGAQSTHTLKDVVGYETLNFQAGVYHKFILQDDMVLYVNDFGIRSILVMPMGTNPYDLPSI